MAGITGGTEIHWRELGGPFISVWHSRKGTYGEAETS